MKHFLFIIMIMMAVFAVSANAADVGVSISVGEPDFYGRIDIGNAPRPEVIYQKPVVIRPAPGRAVEEPIYMRVPPGHEKKWSKHCSKYNACGKPVYFVHDKWYNDVYVPHHQARGKGHDKDRGEKHGREHNKGDYDRGRGHDRD
jgi:hypothetical protein